MLACGVVRTSAQTCGLTWLKQQRSAALSSKAPLDDYLGTQVRHLYDSEYFTLPSDRDYNVRLDLTAGFHYTMLFYTGTDALASGVELRDASGLRLDFQKVYGKPANNWLEVTFEPSRSGIYNAVVRGIFPADRASCAALLVREWDDAEWKEKQRDNDNDLKAADR